MPARVIFNPEIQLQKKELPACNRHPAHALRDQSHPSLTVTTALETSMRKLFILTALIFAFFTGATAAVVGAAIYTQATGAISAEAN